MSYKLYGDGEIWKDGRSYAKIYSDGEIWRDGRLYAKVYNDGEIWKDNRKVGKVYDDGEVYIDNQLWGKIYSNKSSSASKKEYINNDNNGFGFGIPTPNPNKTTFDDLGLPGFGIFVAGFIILLIICTIAALFTGGFELWRTFTIDAISYGFTGVIAALLLVVGTIFGLAIQLNKFNGGFWLGLVVNTSIIIVTVAIGEFIMFGPLAFEELNTDIVTFVGTFAFMAAFPTAICKLISMLGVKLNLNSNKTFKKTAFNNKIQSNPIYKSTQYRKSFTKKTKRNQSIFDVVEDVIGEIQYRAIFIPNIVWFILIGIIFFISWGFAYRYSGYFFWMFSENSHILISILFFVVLIIIHKKVLKGDYRYGLLLFSGVLFIIQIINGLMIDDMMYGFRETIFILGFGQFITCYIGASLGLPLIAYILERHI